MSSRGKQVLKTRIEELEGQVARLNQDYAAIDRQNTVLRQERVELTNRNRAMGAIIDRFFVFLTGLFMNDWDANRIKNTIVTTADNATLYKLGESTRLAVQPKSSVRIIVMIKLIRDLTGAGLKEAKEFVESTYNENLTMPSYQKLQTDFLRQYGLKPSDRRIEKMALLSQVSERFGENEACGLFFKRLLQLIPD